MFGWTSIEEFKNSFIGKWYKEFVFFATCIVTSLWFGAESCLGYINQYIFAPPTAFIMALFVITCDWVSGMYSAKVRGDFSTKKAQRILPKLFANALLLFGFYHLHKQIVVPLDIQLITDFTKTLNLVAAFVMTAIHGLSFTVNCGHAGLIDNKLVKWLTDRVDSEKKKFEDII